MPKLNTTDWRHHDAITKRFVGESLGPYSGISLGDQAGLTQFGVHLETLPPGGRSSFRHWHETEDEFAYVLAGELTLIEDTEQRLVAGEACAWKAGAPLAHCFENRSSTPATYLVVGQRTENAVVHYPDSGVTLRRSAEGRKYERTADGTALE